MTQHIEDARKLEPVAFIVPEALQELEKHSAASATVWSGKATHRFVKDAFPLVRLSDAQAALAAAEERGRMEEREQLSHENGTPRFNAVCARAEAAEARISELEATIKARENGLRVQVENHKHALRRIAELEKRLADAERVIEPFARRAFIHDGQEPSWYCSVEVQVSDLRAARSYMEGK